MDLIDSFISRYRKEYDFYDQAARLVAQLLERTIQSAGIRAMVTFRAKSTARVEEKIRQRSADKKYQNLDDVFRDIVDLAGVRVALYFPGEREQVGKVIGQLFQVDGEPKVFSGTTTPKYSKRFSGYWATHYRVRLRDSALNGAQKRYSDALIEIQLASVVMHAWAEVEHDLVYKPLQGRLSDDEYAILDELNGLVIAGEIALERLQKAGEARVAAQGRIFSNHFDLAQYLLDHAASLLRGPASDALLGRVDILFGLLKAVGIDSPDKLQRYVSSLTSDFERRPISEQIIDQLLAEKASRYKTYEELRSQSALESRSDEATLDTAAVHSSIGRFLSRWIVFERDIRTLAASRLGQKFAVFPSSRLVQQLDVFDDIMLAEVDRIRRLRNNLVHGVEIPQIADIEDATARLNTVIDYLKAALKESSGKAPRNKRRKRVTS